MIVISLVLSFLVSAPVYSQSQSEWRGPGRSGMYPDTGLLKRWPDAGPPKVWSAGDIGSGYSSPSIALEHIYVAGRKDTLEYLSKIDLNGKLVWQIPFGRSWDQSYEDTRTTPTISEGKVYMVSGKGEVVCHDAETGDRIWYRNAYEEFSGRCNLYGISESPLVFGDKVFYTPGGAETSMIALDKNTGELIWKTRCIGDSAAYVSPIHARHNGRDMIISLMANTAFGTNPEDGTILWEFNYLALETPVLNPYLKVTNCNSPIYHEGDIFLAKGYNHPSVMLSLHDEGSAVRVKWTNHLLDTHFGGNVLVNGFLYGSNWLSNSSGNWACIDWATGQDRWEAKMNNKGAIIYADGMLYCYEEKRGQIGLVPANPDSFEIVSSFRVDEGSGPHWSHPVIHRGILYVRHGDRLLAYDITAR